MSAPPGTTARRAGLLYLLSGVGAGFSVFVLTRVVVRQDPAGTASNVLASEQLFRVAMGAEIAGILLVVASVLLLYELLRPAGRTLARCMAVFGVMGCGIQILDVLADTAALIPLKGGPAPASTAEQTQELGYLFLRMHALIYDLALVVFGVFAVLIGVLIRRSTFIPRVLGVFMIMDGLGYLAFGLTTFVLPSLAARMYPVIPFATAILGEFVLMLWLVVRGVDEGQWRLQAASQ